MTVDRKLNQVTTTLVQCAMLLVGMSAGLLAETVEYDLTIATGTVNFANKDVEAMTVNGSIPGPTLTFTEGDQAIIHVHNTMEEETSIHWHGILLPNAMDGVPYLNTLPIDPGETITFKFPIKQSGTYWYHSHTNLQEQLGVYGAIVIHPKVLGIQVAADVVLVLSDWTNENPDQVLRTLKRGSEWYSIKKGSVQSWDRVIANGAILNRLKQSFNRMPPMDISDVYYDRFLVNGQTQATMPELKPGQRIRLRIVNASSATYFYFQYAGGPMQMIAADGQDVEPFYFERGLIAIAETYDVIVTLPNQGAYEFRATAQDISGKTSVFFGRGELIPAPDIPKPNPFKMIGSMDMDGMDMPMPTSDSARQMPMPESDHAHHTMPMHDMAGMTDMKNDSMPAKLLSYDYLRAKHSTALDPQNFTRTVQLELTGNMDRYIWSFNNKTLTEADNILIRRGENVRFVLINKTMMHHPIHLHGHFFRVLNSQGEYSPLKHTVDVTPMQTVTIEFYANEEKDWFFHCHVLYHMMTGMARVISYEGSTVDPELAAARKRMKEMQDNDWFYWGEGSAMSHSNLGFVMLSNNRSGFVADWRADWQGHYEIKADYRRYFSRFLNIYFGGDFSKYENRGVFGIRYVLPFFLASELRIDNEARLRFQVGSETMLLQRIGLDWSVNTDDEWAVSIQWIALKSISLIGNYDSDCDAGVGLLLRF